MRINILDRGDRATGEHAQEFTLDIPDVLAAEALRESYSRNTFGGHLLTLLKDEGLIEESASVHIRFEDECEECFRRIEERTDHHFTCPQHPEYRDPEECEALFS